MLYLRKWSSQCPRLLMYALQTLISHGKREMTSVFCTQVAYFRGGRGAIILLYWCAKVYMRLITEPNGWKLEVVIQVIHA